MVHDRLGYDTRQRCRLKAGPGARAGATGLGVDVGPTAPIVATPPEACGMEDAERPGLLVVWASGLPGPVLLQVVIAGLEGAAGAEGDEPDHGVEAGVGEEAALVRGLSVRYPERSRDVECGARLQSGVEIRVTYAMRP